MRGPLWGKSLPTASDVKQKQKKTKKYELWEFPGIQWLGLSFYCQGTPGWGNKTPQAMWYSQKGKKTEQQSHL